MKRKFHIGWLYVLEDEAPKREQDKVLQLQNEIKPFVSTKDNKVTLKVVK